MLNSSLSILILTLHILDANWRFWEDLVQKDDAKWYEQITDGLTACCI